MKITTDSSKRYQNFEGFGASGAWWAQIVGGWSHIDPESGLPVCERISQLLFSKDNGIALGIYRYNLGGSSAQSGKGDFSLAQRRAESFDADNGEYDWSRDKNAVYMLKQAVKDGADEVTFFVNSPIERLTKNGMAHTSRRKPFTENLSKRNYGAFAKYCCDVAEHFINDGVPIKYISPVNEPLWIWNGGQEGCHYHPTSIKKVFRTFSNEMDKHESLSAVKLSGAENGDIRWFNKAYTRALLKDNRVMKRLDGVDVHSYCHPIPLPVINNRAAYLKRFRRWMDRKYPNVPVRMSEWTHMKGGRDSGMSSALEMAKIMYEDITLLGVTSWQHWIAVSEVNFCDGLIYINLDTKTFETTKRLYATGNFSKFISRGSTRIQCVCDDKELYVLAFKDGDKTTVIAVNPTECDKAVSLDPKHSKTLHHFLTDDTHDLAEIKVTDSTSIITPARSVNTFVY